jgi:hypothetical protein
LKLLCEVTEASRNQATVILYQKSSVFLERWIDVKTWLSLEVGLRVWRAVRRFEGQVSRRGDVGWRKGSGRISTGVEIGFWLGSGQSRRSDGEVFARELAGSPRSTREKRKSAVKREGGSSTSRA